MSLLTRRSFLIRAFALAIVLPTLFFQLSSMVIGPKEGLKLGAKMPMPTYKMIGTDDQSYALADLMKENGLVVIFSCNTCPFVVGGSNFEGWERQYADLNRAAAQKNIGFVLINSNEAKRDGDDSLQEMKDHAEDKGYEMPYLVDKDAALANAFGAKTTPHVYVFNAKNKLVYKGSIDNTWESKREEDKPYLYAAYDFLTDGKKMNDTSSPPRGCSIKRAK